MSKPCAAKVGNHECTKKRVPGKLFCARHMHASNRIYLPRYSVSDEALLQKGGEDLK